MKFHNAKLKKNIEINIVVSDFFINFVKSFHLRFFFRLKSPRAGKRQKAEGIFFRSQDPCNQQLFFYLNINLILYTRILLWRCQLKH